MPRPRDTNVVFFSGNLAGDAELRPGGPARLRILNNRRWKGKDGQWNEKTTGITVKGWDDTADAMADLKKGQQVVVSGRLEQSTWKGKDGNERSELEIIAQQVAVPVVAKEAELPAQEEVPW